MPSPKQRRLKRAAKLVGHENLAARLNVPASLLDAWIRGRKGALIVAMPRQSDAASTQGDLVSPGAVTSFSPSQA